MKNIIYLTAVLVLSFGNDLYSQFSLQVLALSGNEFSIDSNYVLSQTIGETLIGFEEGADYRFSQGFQQGVLVKCMSLKYSTPAEISPDSIFNGCQNSIELSGSIYPNSLGDWYDLDGLLLGNNALATMALDTGENRFNWALSETQCPLYDTAEIAVFRGLAANGVDDYPLVWMELQPNAIEIIQNDSSLEQNYTWELITAMPNGFSVSYSTNPDSLGWLNFVSGQSVGEIPFQYIIANNGYCKKADTATIFMRIQPLYGEGFSDGITPNEDGLNDVFYLCDSTVCDIDIRIFNRWGAQVYKNAHYQNDWNGTNSNGKPLPAGTYYYYGTVNGRARRGNVTILR
jgi:gliding motility-associated-like protein